MFSAHRCSSCFFPERVALMQTNASLPGLHKIHRNMICDQPKSIGALLVFICTCLAVGLLWPVEGTKDTNWEIPGQYIVDKARKLQETILVTTPLTLTGSNKVKRDIILFEGGSWQKIIYDGDDGGRHFIVKAGSVGPFSLSNLNLTRSNIGGGIAVQCDQCSLEIINCNFQQTSNANAIIRFDNIQQVVIHYSIFQFDGGGIMFSSADTNTTFLEASDVRSPHTISYARSSHIISDCSAVLTFFIIRRIVIL